MNKLTIIGLATLASCAPLPRYVAAPRPGDVDLRLSAGAGHSNATIESQQKFFGVTYDVSENVGGNIPVLRAEVSTFLEDGPFVGGYVDFGTGGYSGDVDANHLTVGGSVRSFFLESGPIRPYAEAKGGLRNSWLGDESGLGYEVSAALGLELATSSDSAIFLQTGYGFATSDLDNSSVEFEGLSVFFGYSIRL